MWVPTLQQLLPMNTCWNQVLFPKNKHTTTSFDTEQLPLTMAPVMQRLLRLAWLPIDKEPEQLKLSHLRAIADPDERRKSFVAPFAARQCEPDGHWSHSWFDARYQQLNRVNSTCRRLNAMDKRTRYPHSNHASSQQGWRQRTRAYRYGTQQQGIERSTNREYQHHARTQRSAVIKKT